MNFTQPQGIPTNEQIEAQLTALRVQIGDKQAEIVRQESVINSNRYTIQQLANEKAELEMKVDNLKGEASKLIQEVTDLKIEKAGIKTDIQIATESLKKDVEIFNMKQADLNNREQSLIVRETEFETRSSQLDFDKVSLGEKQDLLDKKIAALTAVINN